MADLIANYIGQKGQNDYWVNVRTSKPSGNIGDAGVVRRFETEEAAKQYAESVNKTGKDTFQPQEKANPASTIRHEGDVFVKAK